VDFDNSKTRTCARSGDPWNPRVRRSSLAESAPDLAVERYNGFQSHTLPTLVGIETRRSIRSLDANRDTRPNGSERPANAGPLAKQTMLA